MIKTWQQRCEEHPDHEGIVSEQMIMDRMQEEIDELRQALDAPEMEPLCLQSDRIRIDPETGNVSIGTPAQAIDLQTAIERGTKAWADVPNASEWVDDLRGNDKPPVTPQVTPHVITEVPCKTHPDAPHGFNRNASFDEDRYVCDCEFWEPVDNVYMSEERVHKTDKSIHEPVDWEAVASDQAMTIAMLKLEKRDNSSWVGLTDEQIYEHRWWDEETAFAVNKELKKKNTAPYAKNDTSDRVLHKEWAGLTDADKEVLLANLYESVEGLITAIEAKLKEKNT